MNAGFFKKKFEDNEARNKGCSYPQDKNLLFCFGKAITPGRGRILLQGKDLSKKRGKDSFPLLVVSRAKDSDPAGWAVNSRYNKDVEKRGVPCNGRELRDKLFGHLDLDQDTSFMTRMSLVHTIHVRN